MKLLTHLVLLSNKINKILNNNNVEYKILVIFEKNVVCNNEWEFNKAIKWREGFEKSR